MTKAFGAQEAAAALDGAGSVINLVGKIALPAAIMGAAGRVLDAANGSLRNTAQPGM